MMYSAYKLNKQGDNIQPRCTPFPVWNLSFVPCQILTVSSWPVYRLLRMQVRWSGIPISLRIFQFVVIHTVRGFNIVNEAEIDVFLELSCFLMTQQMLTIWSLVPLPFLKPAWTSQFSVHVPLKPHLKNCEHYFASMWDECNYVVIWRLSGIAFLWDWNGNWPFPVLWPLLSFPNLVVCWVLHFNSIILQDLK